MEYESPIRQDAMTYVVPIRTTKYMKVSYPSAVSGSHTTPPLDQIECLTYISDMASLYEEYSKKWFNRSMLSIAFIKNVAHDWNHMSIAPPQYENIPIEVHQSWCPVKISVEAGRMTIHWRLLNTKYTEKAIDNVPSGDLQVPSQKSEEVPYSVNQIKMVLKRTSRSEYHRKIRKARLVVAISETRLHKLLLRYTEKYGEVGNASDAESVLSFDSNDN